MCNVTHLHFILFLDNDKASVSPGESAELHHPKSRSGFDFPDSDFIPQGVERIQAKKETYDNGHGFHLRRLSSIEYLDENDTANRDPYMNDNGLGNKEHPNYPLVKLQASKGKPSALCSFHFCIAFPSEVFSMNEHGRASRNKGVNMYFEDAVLTGLLDRTPWGDVMDNFSYR